MEIMTKINSCSECSKNKQKIIAAYQSIIEKNNEDFRESLHSSIVLDPTQANDEIKNKIMNVKNGLDYKKCDKHSCKNVEIASLVSQITDLTSVINNIK